MMVKLIGNHRVKVADFTQALIRVDIDILREIQMEVL